MEPSAAHCLTCHRALVSCACPSTEFARGHFTRTLDLLLRFGRFRHGLSLALAAKRVIGLPEPPLLQATAAAIAIGDHAAARILSASGISPMAAREADELCSRAAELTLNVKQACLAQQWTQALEKSEEQRGLDGILPIQLMRALALHQVGRIEDASRLLARLAVAFPFEATVRDAVAFLQRKDALLRERAQRSARASRWIAGITAIAAAGSLMVLRADIETASSPAVTATQSPDSHSSAARLVTLALSGAADSIADLQSVLKTGGQLSSALEQRLSALRSNAGRHNYSEARRLLATGDTLRAAALLASAAEAGTNNYWVDDALYNLMNILEASGRRQESQRVAQRILAEHPQSAFNNSRTLLLSSQTSQ